MSDDVVSRLNAALEGRYRIEHELGEGGMATVYLADDIRHGRKVALKVLKPELAAVVGAERFLAEIKTTANLQHPHILPLFDSGEADSFLFYVMPYIEGETLRDRLDREKQLPIDEALGIATAVANALQTAHDAGVVHRDIKPGNILMSRGEPLVADFGIALAVGAAGGSRLTETGLSVGTPYYMSPEQATGDQVVGPASDIYALACVLYEMLVGEPPYPGNTAQAVLGKIIQGIPVSARAVRSSIPPNVDAAIRKALEKLPADRFTEAQSFARALSDPGFRHGRGAAAADAGDVGKWKTIGIAAGAAAVVFAGLSAWLAFGGSAGSEAAGGPVFTAVLSDSAVGMRAPVVAGDGTVGYVQNGAVMLRPPGALAATPLAGADGANDFDFSPDGRWIAYTDNDGRLRKVQTLGGGEATLWESDSEFATFPAWGDDGYVYFVTGTGAPHDLARVPDVGGQVEVLLDLDGITLDPAVLPGGRGVALMLSSGSATENRVAVLDLESGDTATVVEGAFSPRWSETGHLLYVMAGGTVWALPFDLSRLEATGPAVPVLEGVRSSLLVADYDVSPDGTLAYVEGAGGGSGGFEFVLMSPEGATERLPLEPSDHYDARISPDGSKLAYTRAGDIWIFDLDRGSNDSLTSGGTGPHNPAWAPDGTRVVYDAGATMMIRPVDRSAPPEEVGGTDVIDYPNQWLEDGTILFQNTAGGGGDLYTIPAEGGQVTPLLNADWQERAAVVSPDGRWIAYSSARDGTRQLYVRSWPDMAGEVRVSEADEPLAQFGQPQWSPDGRILYYHKGQELYAAELDTSDGFRVTGTRTTGAVINGWVQDIHPDGRLLVASLSGGGEGGEGGEASMPRFIVSANWFGALRARLGRGGATR